MHGSDLVARLMNKRFKRYFDWMWGLGRTGGGGAQRFSIYRTVNTNKKNLNLPHQKMEVVGFFLPFIG